MTRPAHGPPPANKAAFRPPLSPASRLVLRLFYQRFVCLFASSLSITYFLTPWVFHHVAILELRKITLHLLYIISLHTPTPSPNPSQPTEPDPHLRDTTPQLCLRPRARCAQARAPQLDRCEDPTNINSPPLLASPSMRSSTTC